MIIIIITVTANLFTVHIHPLSPLSLPWSAGDHFLASAPCKIFSTVHSPSLHSGLCQVKNAVHQGKKIMIIITHRFVPFALETLGAINAEGLSLLSALGGR